MNVTLERLSVCNMVDDLDSAIDILQVCQVALRAEGDIALVLKSLACVVDLASTHVETVRVRLGEKIGLE